MIADHQIQFILDQAREMEEKGKKIDFRTIRAKLFQKWHEDYPEKMLEKVYWHEVGNPKFAPKEVEPDYIDIKRQLGNLGDALMEYEEKKNK
jgi:hypothetical protein